MSGTIPSMETTHDELKNNTIIIGALSFISPPPSSGLPHPLTFGGKSVLGASGDLAKKKVCVCVGFLHPPPLFSPNEGERVDARAIEGLISLPSYDVC